jgi:hypothetical protein
VLAADLSQTDVRSPALRRFRAMAEPMMPIPSTATDGSRPVVAAAVVSAAVVSAAVVSAAVVSAAVVSAAVVSAAVLVAAVLLVAVM